MTSPVSAHRAPFREGPTRTDSCFHNKKEKRSYNQLKSNIQSVFLRDRILINSFNVSFPENKARPSNGGLEKSDFHLTRRTYDRLIRNVANRGFKVEVKDRTFSHKGGSFSGFRVSVLVPNKEVDESGYTSDGWEPSFKASVVKKDATEAGIKALTRTFRSVRNIVNRDPGILQFQFNVDPICPPGAQGVVIDAVEKYLHPKGFLVAWDKNDPNPRVRVVKPFSPVNCFDGLLSYII